MAKYKNLQNEMFGPLGAFKQLLNAMFSPMQIKLLVFALRYDLNVYIYGKDLGKTTLWRALINAGFHNVLEAGNFWHGPEYRPDFGDKYVLSFGTMGNGGCVNIKPGELNSIGNEIKKYIMEDFDFALFPDKLEPMDYEALALLNFGRGE